MVRPITRRVLALVLFAAPAAPVRASEVYQISTISSLLAGGYDGDTTVGELIRHGGFGLGTFNGVDGEMMVVDGEVHCPWHHARFSLTTGEAVGAPAFAPLTRFGTTLREDRVFLTEPEPVPVHDAPARSPRAWKT